MRNQVLIRLPFGVHRLSGRRYPFVQQVGGELVPVASTVAESLTWLSSIRRVIVPDELCPKEPDQVTDQNHTHVKQNRVAREPLSSTTIADWCASCNALSVIGCYVE